MKKIFLVFVCAVLLFGIFAAAETSNGGDSVISPEVSAAVDNAAGTDVGP